MASLLIVVSNVIMMTTTNLHGLYAGRFLLGIANGWYMTFSQLYIQESAPARYRGVMISVFQFWTSIGSLVGTIVDNGTHSIRGKNSYMIPLGVIYVVPVFLCIGLLFIPESPRWLFLQEKNDQGLKALMWMRPNKDAVPEEMAEIQAGILAEKELATSASFIDIFKNPIDRRRTLLAVAAISTQAASGAMFMIGKSTPVNQNFHVEPHANNL